MRQRAHDIYASAPMQGLLADEAAAYMPDVRRCAGSRGLLISAATHDQPPNSPYLGHWLALRLTPGRFHGDVSARTDESLPFLDHAFDLILLRHAFEPALLSVEELVRVLAPGGLLVITGLNPWSGWAPWWLWQTRGSSAQAKSPLQLAAQLRRADLKVERVQRVGRLLPFSLTAPNQLSGWLGGGYVMVARKSGPRMIPTRLRPKVVTAPVSGGLAPGARRSSVS